MLTRLGRTALIAGTSLTVAASAGFATAANASTAAKSSHPSAAAVSTLTNRPDSGDNGTWANDHMTRKATVTLVGNAASSACGGTSPCYHWHGLVSDKGSFTTISGATAPGAGDLNGGSAPTMAASLTGPMKGAYNYDFYSSSRAVSASGVVKTESGAPSGDKTTCLWVEQFFGSSAKFWDNTGNSAGPSSGGCIGTTGGWTYTLGFGADHACPNAASQWVDGSPSWGADASAGNILVPGSKSC
jgi:hypothetical protein